MRHILRCGSFLPGSRAVLSQAQKWLVSASTAPPLNRFLILESGQMTKRGNSLLSSCLYKVFRRLKMFSANRYVEHYEKENFLCVAQFWTVLFCYFCELIFVMHKALMTCKVTQKPGRTKRFHNTSGTWNSRWIKNCEDGNRALKDLNRSYLSILSFQ